LSPADLEEHKDLAEHGRKIGREKSNDRNFCAVR